ncbi:hypothetical protein [Marinobacter sp. AC-23]|uniref:phytanoyl-CoA dioxygenase family protein n=1 Tax=Marinobacter sp. AC-23 TaxID=1879031 RepID=UPI000ACF7A22|nr:hypothetical protein [Marinobacter sp. AC-23]
MDQTQNIDSIVELQGDLARKHKAYTPNEAEAARALVAQDFETLQKNGYVIIEGLLNDSELESIRAATSPLLNKPGRNNFEGVKTQRVYNVLEQTRAIDSLAVHPRITGLLNRLFQPNYLLSQAQIINILPGEPPSHCTMMTGSIRYPAPASPSARLRYGLLMSSQKIMEQRFSSRKVTN